MTHHGRGFAPPRARPGVSRASAMRTAVLGQESLRCQFRGSVSQVLRGRRILAPHRGCAERSAVAAKSSSVDAVSVDQEPSSSVGAREAVVAATAVLQRTGRSDVPFGAERPADEAEFLAAIDELLVELTARRLLSSDVFTGVRAELPSLRDRLLQAALPLNGEGTHANRKGAPRDVG